MPHAEALHGPHAQALLADSVESSEPRCLSSKKRFQMTNVILLMVRIAPIILPDRFPYRVSQPTDVSRVLDPVG